MNTNNPTPRVKHARTPHLPWSQGVNSDDKVIFSLDRFLGRSVVVTEKMDGESTSIYADGLHARSLDSGHHLSRTRVKALQAELSHRIPLGWRIVGENMQAKHSIYYEALPSHFLVFAIFDDKNVALAWDSTVLFAKEYGLNYAPVLYLGIWDEKQIKACLRGRSQFGGESEGYVVRLSDAIAFDEWGYSVAKYVREGHVQKGAEHWSEGEVTRNRLVGEA